MFAKAKQGLAHNTVAPSLLGNRDLKQLQSVINTEKDFVKSHTRTGSDFKDTADALKAWGESEGEDLSDVCGKMCSLYHQYDAGIERFNAHLSNFRLHFKSIRTREEGLSDLKARKRALAARIDALEKKLSKMGPENKQLMQTTGQLKDARNEMVSMESEVRTEESALGDFKRRTARDALSLKCGGLQELAEKMLIIASSGRLLVEQIPTRPTPAGGLRAEYNAFSRTDQILQDATQSLSNVSFRLGSTVATDQTGALTYPYASGALSLYDADETNSQAHPIYAQHASSTTSPQAQTEPLSSISTTPINSAVTPIAARFASTSNAAGSANGSGGGGHTSSLSTDGFKDVAADEWGKAAGLALSGAGQVNTPPPGDAAGTQSFWRDADAPQDASINTANKVPLTTSSAASVSGLSTSGGGMPDVNSGSVDSVPPESRMPRLQVVNMTPSPDDERASRTQMTTGEMKKQYSSNSEFDRSYFTEIGSTRALQESVRRPTSPPTSTSSPSLSAQRYSFAGPSGGGMGNYPPASPQPGSAYEPPEGGRKMSAAAFKRGFARAPSAQSVVGQHQQQQPASTAPAQYMEELNSPTAMTPTASAGAGAGGYGASKDIEPLHIRKRLSVASGHMLMNNSNARIAAEDGMDDAAPPYVPPQYMQQQQHQQQHQHQHHESLGGSPVASSSAARSTSSVYGGVDGYGGGGAPGGGGGGGYGMPEYGYQQGTPWATPMSHQSSTEYPTSSAPPPQQPTGRAQFPPGGW